VSNSGSRPRAATAVAAAVAAADADDDADDAAVAASSDGPAVRGSALTVAPVAAAADDTSAAVGSRRTVTPPLTVTAGADADVGVTVGARYTGSSGAPAAPLTASTVVTTAAGAGRGEGTATGAGVVVAVSTAAPASQRLNARRSPVASTAIGEDDEDEVEDELTASTASNRTACRLASSALTPADDAPTPVVLTPPVEGLLS
jgi:hypothetical protein